MGTQQTFDGLSRRTVRITGFSVAVIFGLVAGWPHLLVAQSSDADGTVRVGDRWVYDVRDETTGYPKDTYTEIVTEISPKEIIVNLTFSGKPGSAPITYDHEWNLIDNVVWRWRPNEGQGIRLPLAVGKTWRATFEAKNLQTAANVKGSASSKVTAQESVTAPAGTFETYRVERQVTWFNPADPAKLWTSEIVNWYAPQINHWVRRTILNKFDKRTRSNTSEELADFSRNL